MWMVWDNEQGCLGIFDNYETALSEYNACKEDIRDYVQGEAEFSGDERLVLAKVEKHFYSYDTKNPVIVENEDGNEVETKDTYWDWKEETF